MANAYRLWALEQPHRYRLLFEAPLVGYDAHQAELVNAAQEAMDVVRDAMSSVAIPTSSTVPTRLNHQLADWVAAREGPGTSSPAAALRAIVMWTRIHGHVRLEIDGNYASMGLDPGLLFEASLPEIFPPPPARDPRPRR